LERRLKRSEDSTFAATDADAGALAAVPPRGVEPSAGVVKSATNLTKSVDGSC
jgi:hypothetical protein